MFCIYRDGVIVAQTNTRRTALKAIHGMRARRQRMHVRPCVYVLTFEENWG